MKEKDYKNKQLAQNLRNNETLWEKKLWYQFLKNHPIKFRRQQRIEGYIVDFYCSEAKLIIELDGGQHYEDIEINERDRIRDDTLLQKGCEVLRFSDGDITTNFEGICKYIITN